MTPDAPDFTYIQYDSDLSGFLAQLAQAELVALDTEFEKSRTFYPRLGLIQCHINGTNFLLDGQSLDLDEVWPLLWQVPRLLLHACSEDVQLLYLLASRHGQPALLTNVWDTQVGMAFMGLGRQLSYQQTVQHWLGLTLNKGESRSDWISRPLRSAQLHYAAHDVAWLPETAARLDAALAQRGLLDWAREDSRQLAVELAQQPEPCDAWQTLAHPRYSARQLAQLQQLCAWREQLVRVLDEPRSFVLRDNVMATLVERPPRTLNQLAQVRGIHPNVLREHGRTILDLLQFLPDEQEWPQRLEMPWPLSDAQKQYISQLIQEQADRYQLPADILMRKRWQVNLIYCASQLAQGDTVALSRLSPYLTGWRHAVITEPLLQWLVAQMQATTVA